MKDKESKEKYEPKLKPTLENLDSIQKSFDKVRKDISKQKKIEVKDFKIV